MRLPALWEGRMAQCGAAVSDRLDVPAIGLPGGAAVSIAWPHSRAALGALSVHQSRLLDCCFNLGTLLWRQQFECLYFREPYILALTHLAALGWLTTGLMGVMYATLPATLGVRPHSLRMAPCNTGCRWWASPV